MLFSKKKKAFYCFVRKFFFLLFSEKKKVFLCFLYKKKFFQGSRNDLKGETNSTLCQLLIEFYRVYYSAYLDPTGVWARVCVQINCVGDSLGQPSLWSWSRNRYSQASGRRDRHVPKIQGRSVLFPALRVIHWEKAKIFFLNNNEKLYLK